MTRPMPPWIRDILILPLSVGVAISVFGFILPKAFNDEKELSYSTEGPVVYLHPNSKSGPKISVNRQGAVLYLVGYKVRIWNSGDLPLEKLPILLLFRGGGRDFAILSATRSTTPSHEFGNIIERHADARSRRYEVELMNTGDVLEVALLATASAKLEVFSKAHGMRLRRVELR